MHMLPIYVHVCMFVDGMCIFIGALKISVNFPCFFPMNYCLKIVSTAFVFKIILSLINRYYYYKKIF